MLPFALFLREIITYAQFCFLPKRLEDYVHLLTVLLPEDAVSVLHPSVCRKHFVSFKH